MSFCSIIHLFTGRGRRESTQGALGSFSHLSQHRRGTEPEQTPHSPGRAGPGAPWMGTHKGQIPNLGCSCRATGHGDRGQSWAGTHSVPTVPEGPEHPRPQQSTLGTRTGMWHQIHPWDMGCGTTFTPGHSAHPGPAVTRDPARTPGHHTEQVC